MERLIKDSKSTSRGGSCISGVLLREQCTSSQVTRGKELVVYPEGSKISEETDAGVLNAYGRKVFLKVGSQNIVN